MKKVTVSLSTAGIDKLIKAVEQYEARQKQCAATFLERLAQLGLDYASAQFSTAVYDGTNDVSVTVEERGENVKAIVATGNATLFIEFGTGVTYADDHPQAAELGMRRGEYGKGHGKRKAWGYYGDDPGTNGVVKEKPDGSAVIITRGNPANMPMYKTVRELEENLTKLAKEVFK